MISISLAECVPEGVLTTAGFDLAVDCFSRIATVWNEFPVEFTETHFRSQPHLGFWAALREVYAATREQRCWVHKTANVLNKMPKSVQPKAKADLHEIWQAETREMGNKAFDNFLEKYGAKYSDACECLRKDRDELLTFYDFPAEHWGHLRTTNPIESTFATIRLRHRRTKGNGTRRASLTMMFKLAQATQKTWRRLNGHQLITLLIQGRVFVDGVLRLAA